MTAALQPVIPMKVVTWAAGIVGIPIGPYLACMAVGRGKRLYLLAAAIRWGSIRGPSGTRTVRIAHSASHRMPPTAASRHQRRSAGTVVRGSRAGTTVVLGGADVAPLIGDSAVRAPLD